ncbi:acyl-CoA dehydrogenase family protein [Hoeflea poritis]|uniref:Acyl-CoA dehydrogenase family protein n=1 Tax=Hoeflea poritis TaxID=2993659 RepID=A0ABT4VV09_9HYPH|nr:acyl-CoA dehydrogenase family protein [Hoeflea poritis]MDA4848534.1 acyl-CoA dehydrogenase family protein [Hoeflea poritis]
MTETVSLATEQQVRDDVRDWIALNWNVKLSLSEWRELLADSGWGAPSWPARWYGKGLPATMNSIVEEEFFNAQVVGVTRKGANRLAAQTILAHGTDAHKKRFLRPMLTGAETWCQLFSEPGSGSDLAGAMTRAVRDGDRYIVNGQKVWTSMAHISDWGILLARTDMDVPKHQGLSFFLIDMRQPGIEVRPLRQMNGHASFNEVFFDNAVVNENDRLEDEGDGWRVATTTLLNERRNFDVASKKHTGFDRQEQIYVEEAEEIAVALAPHSWYPQREGRIDLLLPRAIERGKFGDAALRQEIARLFVLQRCREMASQRARAAIEAGGTPGPEGSVGKLAGARVSRECARVHTIISGADAMLDGVDSELNGTVAEIFLSTPANSLAGGTDEIQKNILAERVLGMPKEPRNDVDRPFKGVPKNAL